MYSLFEWWKQVDQNMNMFRIGWILCAQKNTKNHFVWLWPGIFTSFCHSYIFGLHISDDSETYNVTEPLILDATLEFTGWMGNPILDCTGTNRNPELLCHIFIRYDNQHERDRSMSHKGNFSASIQYVKFTTNNVTFHGCSICVENSEALFSNCTLDGSEIQLIENGYTGLTIHDSNMNSSSVILQAGTNFTSVDQIYLARSHRELGRSQGNLAWSQINLASSQIEVTISESVITGNNSKISTNSQGFQLQNISLTISQSVLHNITTDDLIHLSDYNRLFLLLHSISIKDVGVTGSGIFISAEKGSSHTHFRMTFCLFERITAFKQFITLQPTDNKDHTGQYFLETVSVSNSGFSTTCTCSMEIFLFCWYSWLKKSVIRAQPLVIYFNPVLPPCDNSRRSTLNFPLI